MSKTTDGQRAYSFDAGASRPDNMVLNGQGRSHKNPVTSTAQENSPFVSCWEFPLMDNNDKDQEKEDFRDQLARLERDAYEKGFEQGRKDGLEIEEKKIEEMGKQFESVLTELRDLKARIYKESEGELLKLGILMAKKIINEEVTINRGIIGNTIRSALKFLADKRKIKVLINPEDMEEVRRLLPDMAKISNGGQFQLAEDHTIDRGGCILETGFGKINANITDQMTMLEEEIERQYHSSKGASHEPLP